MAIDEENDKKEITEKIFQEYYIGAINN